MSKISDREYNFQRKQILFACERSETVSNLLFDFYDLTSYLKDPSFDCSMSEKRIFFYNEKRRIFHSLADKPLYFFPEQEDALRFISRTDRAILMAPTSFGKTLILKEYIYRYQPASVVYIVPTNALAYELENSFKENPAFRDYLIFDKVKLFDASKPESKLLFIGTQERYLEAKDALPKSVSLFVIDEAYKLEEAAGKIRGYKLAEAFLDSINRESKKIVLLSPNAEFAGFDKYQFSTYSTYFNAVDQDLECLNEESFYQRLADVSSKEKTILYCPTPDTIASVGPLLPKLSSQSNSSFYRQLAADFHPEWTVAKLFKQGILVHHGIMPKYIQNKMLRLFINDPEFTFLVGTNSISEGINTPAKNIFLHPDTDVNQQTLLIKNTIGRAGRLGVYPIGHIYSISNLSKVSESNICIRLSLSTEENSQELEKTQNSALVDSLCDACKIDRALYDLLVSKYQLSYTKILRLLKVLAKPVKYESLFNLPLFASAVFEEDYPTFTAHEDSAYIRGYMQSFYYKKGTGEEIPLSSYSNRIAFFRQACPKPDRQLTDSAIVDGYMKFLYSSLDFYICPIANAAKDIYKQVPSWSFGGNVLGSIDKFLAKYYSIFWGMNFEDLTDNQKKIVMALREYGIATKGVLTLEMIKEIDETLNVRYSTFDILSAITKLSNSSSANRDAYKLICLKYL